MKSSQGDCVFHSKHCLTTATTVGIPPMNVFLSGKAARQVPILLTYRSISTMTMLVFPTLLKLRTSILSLSKSSDQFQLLTRE